MILSRRTVGILIALIIVALGGLLLLQYRFLQRTLNLKDQTFRQSVYSALNTAVALIEEADARDRFFLFVSDSAAPETLRIGKLLTEDQRIHGDSGRTVVVSAFTTGSGSSTSLVGNRLSYQLGMPQKVTVKVFDPFGRLDTVLIDTQKAKGKHEIELPDQRLRKGVYFIQIHTDSMFSTYRWDAAGGTVSFDMPAGKHSEEKIIRRVTESITRGTALPLGQRLRKEELDSVLAQVLHHAGIRLSYGFEVRDRQDSLVTGRVVNDAGESREAGFSVPIFSHDFAGVPATLLVWFPEYRFQLMSEFIPESALHLVFIGVVLACFWYTLRAFWRQKVFAESVTNFINNMTHEFKTPLSTIALASEALDRPDVLLVQSKIATYNRVIAEENTRMRRQVEKILHMAALEEGEVEFRRDVLAMHAIIEKAVNAAAVQVSARHGTLSMSLNAHHSTMTGDAVHIENVIRNVLDNAEKYSPRAPHINVQTSNAGNSLVVRISDSGIGMTKEEAGRAFDKYYRSHTGNIHDVKGFGIGLSYVKLVVEGHGGSAAIQSEKGKGTTIEMRFPATAP